MSLQLTMTYFPFHSTY